MSNDYSLSDIQRALNEKKAKQSKQRQNLVESMAQQMPVKHVSEEDKRFQVTEQRLTALANRVENLMGMSGRLSLVEEAANTLVSGIGHNANGASQGSGIVKVADADDMEIHTIAHGETIRWDQSIQKFLPATGGTGGGGTLQAVMVAGPETDITMRFLNDAGINFNDKGVADTSGFLSWKTNTTSQGGLVKTEVLHNGADSAQIIHIDTKYDQDKNKGYYIQPSNSATGDIGGVTLTDFDANTIDPFLPENIERVVNVDVLNERIEAEHAILIERMIQRVTFADSKDIDGTIYTGSVTQFKLMVKFGIHNTGTDGLALTPTPLERFPKDSYILLEKEGTADYGLFQILDDGAVRGPTTEFIDIQFLDGQGKLEVNDIVNVYAFNKNYDLTLLQLILHEIEARVAKDGDEMTGRLTINNKDKVKDPVSFEILGSQSGGGGSNYVFSSHLDAKDRDIVTYHGPVEDEFEVATKKYIDNLIQSLAGGLNYLGEIDDTDDLTTIEQSPDPGDFYIFADDGDWEGDPVKKGDWLVYDGTDWDVLGRDLSADYLPLTGGTMKGDITMGPGKQIRMDGTTPILTRRIDSGNDSNLELFRDGDRKLQIADGLIQTFNTLKINANGNIPGSGNLEVRNGCQLISGGKNIMNWFGNGVKYMGQETDDDNIVTKKYVDDATGGVTGFVKIDGSSTMSGNLLITRTTNGNTEAGITLTGQRPDATDSACTIKFINKELAINDTNSGYLTYRASSSDRYFRFSKRLEVKGDFSCNSLTTSGTASTMKYLDIDVGNNSSNALRVRGAVRFKGKGQPIGGSNIFEVTEDKVVYNGDVVEDNNVATKKYVDSNNVKQVVSLPSGSDIKRGTMYLTGNNVVAIGI